MEFKKKAEFDLEKGKYELVIKGLTQDKLYAIEAFIEGLEEELPKVMTSSQTGDLFNLINRTPSTKENDINASEIAKSKYLFSHGNPKIEIDDLRDYINNQMPSISTMDKSIFELVLTKFHEFIVSPKPNTTSVMSERLFFTTEDSMKLLLDYAFSINEEYDIKKDLRTSSKLVNQIRNMLFHGLTFMKNIKKDRNNDLSLSVAIDNFKYRIHRIKGLALAIEKPLNSLTIPLSNNGITNTLFHYYANLFSNILEFDLVNYVKVDKPENDELVYKILKDFKTNDFLDYVFPYKVAYNNSLSKILLNDIQLKEAIHTFTEFKNVLNGYEITDGVRLIEISSKLNDLYLSMDQLVNQLTILLKYLLLYSSINYLAFNIVNDITVTSDDFLKKSELEIKNAYNIKSGDVISLNQLFTILTGYEVSANKQQVKMFNTLNVDLNIEFVHTFVHSLLPLLNANDIEQLDEFKKTMKKGLMHLLYLGIKKETSDLIKEKIYEPYLMDFDISGKVVKALDLTGIGIEKSKEIINSYIKDLTKK